MTRPRRFLFRMTVFLLLTVAIVVVLLEQLTHAFSANPPLNGLILGVLLLGIAYSFRQVLGLSPELRWIEGFRASKAAVSTQPAPRLLAPMAKMLADRQGKMMLSTMATRSLLDSIAARLDESRDISRYMIGLLIFLGLLGTFWGLLDTVGSVSTVIKSLAIADEDIVSTFTALKAGLDEPLRGMGTAFSSSLFGLSGSLVLGFLDLQSGQAQNQFYNDLEEWLSSVTRLSSGAGIAEGDQSVPVYVQALLEQTADSLEGLQRTLSRGEEDRQRATGNIMQLTERLATLTDQMRAEQDLMVKLVESQMDMKPVLERLSEASERDTGIDEATRGHIRNLDVYMMRLLEETVNGRSELASEIRSEIKLLARTIAASAGAAAARAGAQRQPAAAPAPAGGTAPRPAAAPQPASAPQPAAPSAAESPASGGPRLSVRPTPTTIRRGGAGGGDS
ncbi:MAG TPA: flagellar motor protein MotA [Alphaproteobacteria bacterium]